MPLFYCPNKTDSPSQASISWIRTAAVGVVLSLVTAVVVVGGSAPPAYAEGCGFGPDTDFNGDGYTDMAIADPDATVSSQAKAGRVHVVYGGNEGSLTISEASPFMSAQAGASEHFGQALAVYDANVDGCDDLVIGVPGETVNSAAGAGAVYVVHGSPAGLANGQVKQLTQETTQQAVSEAGDYFGYSIAAGNDAEGNPFLLTGSPGEDLTPSNGTVVMDAGMAFYLRPNQFYELYVQVLVQDLKATGAIAESGDQFGYTVAADTRHFAVGVPFEDVEDQIDSGTVHLYEHGSSEPGLRSVPLGYAYHVALLNQVGSSQGGAAESGDRYGQSVSLSRFLDTDGKNKSILAVGVPGEAVGVHAEAGRVVATLSIDSNNTIIELASIHQAVDGVYGSSEPGDEFGWRVALINRNPGVVPAWSDLLLVVGIPGEEGTELTDTGGIQVFSALGAPGDHDAWVDLTTQADSGFTLTSGARLGQSLTATSTHLYIGDPDGTAPAVYALPWGNILDGETSAIRKYAPGRDGLPTSGVGAFGHAVL